jgi:hypothetical protein
VLAVVAVDGGVGMHGDEPREQLRERLAPPRFSIAPDDLPAMLRQGPLAPWWSQEVEDAVLPIFGVGDDGLARARLTYERHMQCVDGMLDYDANAVMARVAAPAWLVVADSGDDWSRAKQAGLDEAVNALARPRAFTLRGALHDVPLQWPAVVSGVVRAAADEVASAVREGRA